MNPLLAVAVLAVATPPDPSTARLAGLARVWAQVKYVHPAMATTDVDWDEALVRAIPEVERAGSDRDFRRAIAGLLAELRDPATRVVEDGPAAPVAETVTRRIDLERLDERTALLSLPSDTTIESIPTLRDDVCARFAELTRFERAIVDLRGPSRPTTGWTLQDAIVKCASRLVSGDVPLPPARVLTHGFYMMQGVTGGPGGGLGPWESGVTLLGSGSIRGEAPRTPRLAFLVNEGTAAVDPLLMAFQADGRAMVVLEGERPTAGLMVKTFEAGESLAIAVRHGEWLRGDGGAGLRADAVVTAREGEARRAAIGLLDRGGAVSGASVVSTPLARAAFVERDSSETPFPDRNHRLLALFRLYAVVGSFFPYRDLMDRPWNETLVEFIPRLRDARDQTDYALTLAELCTRLQDSHVTLASPVLDAYFGTHRPAVRVDRVEAQTVVTEIAPELAETGLRLGDILVSVDGEDVGARRERLARYLPASTPGRLQNKIDIQLLLGPRAQPAALVVRAEDGTLRRATIPRTLEGLASRSPTRGGPTYSVLPAGFGYVDLQRLTPKDIDAAMDTIRGTPGAIFDMRGYPVGGAFALVPRLAQTKAAPSAIGGAIRYDGTTGEFELMESLWTGSPSPPDQRYRGRIVVLADGSSQSAAEHVCALIRSVAPATFVGSRTSGANGAVTRTILPGGIVVNFTGQSVRHADGSPLQRVGIVPDVEVQPTVRGIREGRDEVLERAVLVLQKKG